MQSERLVNILLVEDDQVDRMNVKRAFEKNNILNPLYIAKDGIEALDLLKGTNGNTRITPSPKIMLLDINMPRMNGIDLLKEMRKDDDLKTISVFIMTTSNDSKDKYEAYAQNVAGYILKPLSFEKFATAISVLKTYWSLTELPE